MILFHKYLAKMPISPFKTLAYSRVMHLDQAHWTYQITQMRLFPDINSIQISHMYRIYFRHYFMQVSRGGSFFKRNITV